MPAITMQTAGSTGVRAPCPKKEVHPFDLRKNVEHFERGHISNILQLAEWDLDDAADTLGVCRKTVQNKMRKYDLKPFSA